MMPSAATKKCALNLISGQLGSGKTTLLRQLLKQKPPQEHWVILVNEFGAVGIDGAILSEQSHTQIQQIPGGCICCTAKSELTNRILTILDTQAPDRILIEPTGLGEPQNLIDLLQTSGLAKKLDIQALFSLFDMTQADINEVKQLAIFQSLMNMADVILLNKTDLADPQKTAAFQHYLANLYPPKTAVIATQHAQISPHYLTQPHFTTPKYVHQNMPSKQSQPHSTTPLMDTGITLNGCHTRQSQQDLRTQSLGWVFDPQIQFDWKKCQALFNFLAEMPNVLLRAKGVFRVGDSPRMLFQLVHQTVSRELIAYRKDSRLEILLTANHAFNLVEFEQRLANSIIKVCTAENSNAQSDII